ncbi:MAG: cysteine desulfurase [bacterium]
MNREDFKMFDSDIIYFDNGATTFKPNVVIDSMTDYYQNYCANAHRGDYDISYKVDIEYEKARDVLKTFINASSREEIVFTSGATESLNMIATGFFEKFLEPNDEILITESEHASNILPWFKLAQKKNLKVNYIQLDENYHVTLENVKKSITSKTKVIAIAEITNVIGDLRPIKEITKLAHENDIFVVVDAAQSIPHKKIDVIDSDVDFLVASAHKMCGPTGVGLLYGKKDLLEELDPTSLGGGMNESFKDVYEIYLKELPFRLEAGTPNIAGVIGYSKAADYLMNIGLNNINEYEIKLRKYLVDKMIKIPHIDIINLEADSGIVSFNVDGIFPQDVAYYLNDYNICLRAGNHCAKNLENATKVKNTLRISLYFYNTESEIDALIELLENKNKIEEEII